MASYISTHSENTDETSDDHQLLCTDCDKPGPICRHSAFINDLHGQNIHDSINKASRSSPTDEHNLFSNITRHQNGQQDQPSPALLFEPFRSLLSDLLHQNKQLIEDINQVKKQSQLQHETLLDQLIEQSKKNAKFQLEIDHLKEQYQLQSTEQPRKNEQFQVETNRLEQKSSEHETQILKLKTDNQNQKTKIQEIDQQHNLLEINSRSFNPIVEYSPGTRWKQTGLTVAGGNGEGNKLNQLAHPFGIFIEDDQTIYIADSSNHRIVEWKSKATSGRIVAGGNQSGNQMNQLKEPTDVIIDKENNAFIIADHGNSRVMQWSRQNNTNREIIISDIDCWGLTMDKIGSLYVSDCEKDEVKRWKKGEKNGTVVAGGNGKGTRLNQLNTPTSIFVDQDYSLYVSDCYNHRVIKWLKDAREGIIVAGGQGLGSSLTQLSYPWGVSVNHLGQIYMADGGNNRVLCCCKGTKTGMIVVGGNGEGKQLNQLHGPNGLSFDRQGNLYIADDENHRIQKFEIDENKNNLLS